MRSRESVAFSALRARPPREACQSFTCVGPGLTLDLAGAGRPARGMRDILEIAKSSQRLRLTLTNSQQFQDAGY
jgi:hypothetical protein